MKKFVYTVLIEDRKGKRPVKITADSIDSAIKELLPKTVLGVIGRVKNSTFEWWNLPSYKKPIVAGSARYKERGQ